MTKQKNCTRLRYQLCLAVVNDAARPSTVKYYQSLIPHATFALISNAAHSTMNDNTAADAAAITNFLNSLDK